MHADCLVRKLRIRTGEKSHQARITFLIEDALRTASFPGLPPNGVVYIKSLNLGRFPSTVSASFLSARIDSFVTNLRPVRITAETESYDIYSAVWFPDKLEPYRILINKLTTGYLPDEWFWPIAVTGYSAAEPVSKNIQNILFQGIQKKAGISGLAYVLCDCFEKNRILKIIDYLEEIQCSKLISFLGLKPPRINIYKNDNTTEYLKDNAVQYFADSEEKYIEETIYRWGINDSRSVFLAGLVLARNGQKITDRTLSVSLSNIFRQIQEKDESSFTAPLENPLNNVPHTPSEEKHDYPSALDSSKKIVPNEKILPDNPGAEKDLVQGIPAAISEPTPDLSVLADNRAEKAKTLCPEQQIITHPYAGTYSLYSGFPLLINVLERLNIKDIFADHPEYPVDCLQKAILWRIARWQKIPQKDIAAGFLSNFKDIINEIEFAHFLITYRDIIKKIHPHNQEYFSSPLSRRPMKPLNLKQMLNLFLTAVCRYVLKRSGGMSVSDFIKRPAYIAITKTHMDITASIRTIDIHIRSAGLDINPGWIPWLGRVFQIHYTEEVI